MYIHMAGTDLASTESACNGIGKYCIYLVWNEPVRETASTAELQVWKWQVLEFAGTGISG